MPTEKSEAKVENANINLSSSTVGTTSTNGAVYGGGNNGQVLKNASTTITNSNIGESAYAGGNGSTATVVGNNLINIEGTTNIVKHLFGGGNAAETGCATDVQDNTGTTIMTCSSTKIRSDSRINLESQPCKWMPCLRRLRN